MMVQSMKMYVDIKDLLFKQKKQRLVDKMLYLINTRNDITHPIQQLSQFLNKRYMQHFKPLFE